MGQSMVGLMEIVGPIILLIVLIWLVVRSRSGRDDGAKPRSEAGTRDLYADEETRRREGTDDL